MDWHLAVHVENASKAFGTKKVLNNFCMHVPKGIIYGLLGASGCGKTTLLNCLVGGKNLDSGKLSVLGINPDLSGVPSSRIGYMPQDIAIAVEFTTREAVIYFGRLYGIRDSVIKERFKKLSKLINLPNDNKLIKKCSGGEKRRVSFAVALINNPELLILDEPTVGLDPVLREILWDYLLGLVKEQNTAVIITTHYIEEAHRAHKVGFMRQGRLLAEESPEKLLTFYETNTLEEVFLKLSEKQIKCTDGPKNEKILQSDNPEIPVSATNIVGKTKVLGTKLEKRCPKRHLHELYLSVNRMKALFGKNLIQISRNLSGTLFTFVFPIISMLALLTGVGDVRDINIAIVNNENLPSHCGNIEITKPINSDCKIQYLSCKFIQELEDPMINKIFLNNTNDALNQLNHGNVWGVLYIPPDFSEAFQERLEMGLHATDYALNSSQIIAWMDNSNKQIEMSVKFKLVEKIMKLQKDVLEECSYSSPPDSVIQLKFLYGDKNDKFTAFLIPGILLTIIFFVSVTNTVDTIISDRLGGIWDRSAVAGVSSLEIILTHFVTQMSIVIIQVVELVILTFFIYKTEYKGTLIEITIILLIGGISGMFYGFWISVVCKNHSIANFLSTGSFYPLIIISGVIWPLEGMSKILQYCAVSLPIALPTNSLRSIIQRGWNFANSEVLTGMGVQILWIILLGVICVFQLKNNR